MADRNIPPTPSADVFTEVLFNEADWYSLGVFLGATAQEMDAISQRHHSTGITRCLIELYTCLERKGKNLSWDVITKALRRMRNNSLADKIDTHHILPLIRAEDNSYTENTSTNEDSFTNGTEVYQSSHTPIVHVEGSEVDKISIQYVTLSERFVGMLLKIKRAFKNSNVDVYELQDFIQSLCGVPPLPSHHEKTVTTDAVFKQLGNGYCSILNFRVLIVLVENFLVSEKKDELLEEMHYFNLAVDEFKSSTNMVALVQLIQEKQVVATSSNDVTSVKLKVQEFWHQFTMRQFETVMNKIFETLYKFMSHISVGVGCICISWIVPSSINAIKILPELASEFVQIIGVISLHIGDDVVYNIKEIEGCRKIEAAMLQAVELKNTQAVELLLAVGCNPEIATYNGNNTVTNIVNIRESDESGTIDYICLLGHNEHIKSICMQKQIDALQKTIKELHQQIDTLSSQTPECSFCVLKNKMLKQLYHQVHTLVEMKDLHQHIDTTIRTEVATNNESVIGIKKVSEFSEAIVPCHRLAIGAKMTVTVITIEDSGVALKIGGLPVKGTLSCNSEECPVTDNGDGTYLITVICQQLGQHQLFISVNNQNIQYSPFPLNIVPKRDYSQLSKEPLQKITDVEMPVSIAFADNGDMFATSHDDRYHVHVYDSNGKRIANIGHPHDEIHHSYRSGLAVNGDLLYVINDLRNKIEIFKTSGKFIENFLNEFQILHPINIHISPNHMMLVADHQFGSTKGEIIKVFSVDLTLSHVIDGDRNVPFSCTIMAACVAFDLSGNVHVPIKILATSQTNAIAVFSPTGQFVRKYGEKQLSTGQINGIAIDLSGCSLVAISKVDKKSSSLLVFNPDGRYIHSVLEKQFNAYEFATKQSCVAISPDGSLWMIARPAEGELCEICKY